jgi:predicted ribosomally synthesized peptide with SipW-like signal peptide
MDELDPRVIEQRRRRRRRGLVVLILGLALASLGAGAFSLAIFTDSAASNGTFTAGTIDIATSPTTLFTVTNMMPGDSGSATLNVQNNGSAQLRYAMTSTATNTDTLGLRSQLGFTITAGACPGAGAPLYNSVLQGAAFGNPATGPHAGDRTLNSLTSEDLCFAWSLPFLTTGPAFMGATTTATFTFSAEQTANNP